MRLRSAGWAQPLGCLTPKRHYLRQARVSLSGGERSARSAPASRLTRGALYLEGELSEPLTKVAKRSARGEGTVRNVAPRSRGIERLIAEVCSVIAAGCPTATVALGQCLACKMCLLPEGSALLLTLGAAALPC